ncbi:protein Niban [Pundamilia nyererei]|uniref:Niban apoptosis regulator 1 n=1 Tax=Pundamilia nyererei TaxID=303518 RepID=A0A3B4FCN7_9CICH|nr:PREDICTED: protein Niban [Pundamilia nyererei]
MGGSASSLLDENKSKYIKGQAEAVLEEFSPYYRKQFSVAQFSQVEDDVEQHKQKITQLLKQRAAPEEGEVLYEESVFYFDDTRKWRERYVVVRANYCLECHESVETFVKGAPPCHKLLPTGGKVLTAEEAYMAVVDKCFPDESCAKEDFAPPIAGMPGQFPVYLRLPYRRDSYFCFKQQATQATFISILSDCIRHQNQDFLKKKTCEVQAFLKAIQLYRQDKGKYEAWDMLIGSDARVMANMVMEQLLPSLEKDMLPGLKAKKTERKRVWFAMVEAVYILVQEDMFEGLSALKEECRVSVRQQEVLIHSDMDQILNSRRQLEEKIRAKVSEPAEKLCSDSVQPYLGSVLEELMEPISAGFQEGRQLSENTMDQVYQDIKQGCDNKQLKQSLDAMAKPNLLNCYEKIGSLQVKLQHLQARFGFSDTTGVMHSAQIDLQQLIENAAFTFEQLLYKAIQDNPDNASSATEKVKHIVLKKYDYDSSTVRKRIFQEALVSITLPFIKKSLVSTCKPELQGLEQIIYSDHSSFVHVDNVYENILLQILDKEVTKVVKEAANLKKYNLFTDKRDLTSQSSLSSLPASIPGSPAMTLASLNKPSLEPQPSPLASNDVFASSQKQEQQEEGKDQLQSEALKDMIVGETPLGKVETGVGTSSSGSQESDLPALKAEDVIQTAAEEAGSNSNLNSPDLIENMPESCTNDTAAAVPAIVMHEDVISVKTEETKTAAEPETNSADAPQEPPTAVGSITTTEAPKQAESLNASNLSAEGTESLPANTEAKTQCENPEIMVEAPPSGEALGGIVLSENVGDAEPVAFSETSSLAVSVGSESHPSDVESTDDVSTSSDILEGEANIRKSPVGSGDATEDITASDKVQTEVKSGTVIGTGAIIEVEAEEVEKMTTSLSSEPVQEETPSSPAQARPLDCVKEIRDLVVEVIEVEEPVQHYHSGISKED